MRFWIVPLFVAGLYCIPVHAQEAVPVTVNPAPSADATVQPGGALVPALPPGVESIPQGGEVAYGSKTLGKALDLVSARRWGALLGLLLMVACAILLRVFVWSKEFREKVRDFMPEFVIGLSVAGYCGVALYALPVGAHLKDWWDVLGPALVTGAVAIGGWEFIVKRAVGFWVPLIWRGIKWLLRKVKLMKPAESKP